MSLRKCQISNMDGDLFTVKFHGFFPSGNGGVSAIIERDNGIVETCEVNDVQFLAPEHPIVEVDESGKEPRWGEFHGWYQWNSGIESGAMGLVRYDDGTCGEVDPKSIRFLKGGSDGQ